MWLVVAWFVIGAFFAGLQFPDLGRDPNSLIEEECLQILTLVALGPLSLSFILGAWAGTRAK